MPITPSPIDWQTTALFSSRSEEWATPSAVFEPLDAEFHFTLDPCASALNAKCAKFYTVEQNGLLQEWTGERVFVNPPYGKKIGVWMQKCYEESRKRALVVALVHARTDTRWFHAWVYGKATLRFLKGRVKFGGSKHSSPFPSLIAIYQPEGT